ncbi:Signal transduction histidine kinase [Chitinophaga sp. YR573]|uniref:sensor histidine kinase n=1 Tax=Chitinophaga sp. YR573 TaxID=1881040 RepID=UPI0008D75A37|nr:ATP-binding protein [Chitinophaga sp. YR573]SEW28840.1 Signal transduction histidine kinase [Chitinophaga sp. YR573]
MKLLDKYNRFNLLSTIAVFILAGVAFYFALHFTLLRQMDEDLMIEQREIKKFVDQNDAMPHPVTVKDQQIILEQTTQPVEGRKFKIVKIPKDDDDYRQLSFSIMAAGKWYNVQVRKSLEGTDIITHSVFLITICTILLMFIATFIINRTILKRLWQPFYHSLDILQHFKVGNQQRLQFPTTGIDEFNFMNTTLERSTAKALQDYNALKVFTENASHELQTPLAIIRSKMEVIMQGENLSEYQFAALQSATEALNKLARMNQSLLLLTKIENEQFALKSMVEIDQLLIKKAEQFNELWEDRLLQPHLDIKPVTLHVNKELVELLLNNLFSNATRHNYDNGEIFISLDKEKLAVGNTGNNTPLSKTHLFQRFYNPSNSSTSNGLGLAVIRQICEASGLIVEYDYTDNKHLFTILF